MIDKKVNAEEQVQRMKNLMNYGLKESKQPAYSTVEYSKVGADGKLYGIVREGAKYYIKTGKSVDCKLIAENFDYIGGFRNRNENMFESFASAQRYLVEKMIDINSNIEDKQKRVIAESWDINARKDVIEEGTKQMQAEIARQRQIMKNIQNINEGKSQECGKKQECDMQGGCPPTDVMKVEEIDSSNPSAPFTVSLKNSDVKKNEKTNITDKKEPVKGKGADKKLKESTETPLVSRENPEYMDKSHGTKIGNNAPFDNTIENKTENAVAEADGGEAEQTPETKVVNEEVALHSTDNQNSPAPGVGDLGDNQPFEDEVSITEDVEGLDDTLEDDEDFDGEDDGDFDSDDDFEGDDGDDFEGDDDVELELTDDEVEPEEGVEESDTEARLNAMEEKLNQILDAINDMKYDDDELYDDDDDNDDDGENEYELDMDDEGPIDEPEEEEDDDYEVVESKSYKVLKQKMLKEENDFGQHPAFQKKVMTTPPVDMTDGDGQYDMNDDSVKGEKPYAISKGNQKPFEISPEKIENEIIEAVMRDIKKKLA